jgi:hypothetical protein
MFVTDREKLRTEYFELDKQRKETSDNTARRKLSQRMGLIDRQLANTGDIELTIKSAMVSVDVSVFHQQGLYRGPCGYGTCLGDGNYWKRGGSS